MAKASGGASGGVSKYRSGRTMALLQNDGTTRRIRFNQSANRYEYYNDNPYINAWKPLQDIRYSFQSLDVVESDLRRNKEKVQFI